MEEKMIAKINFYIAKAVASFKANNNEWTDDHTRILQKRS